MGHRTRKYQPGPAAITLGRSTQTLPAEPARVAICSTRSSPSAFPRTPLGADAEFSFPPAFPRLRRPACQAGLHRTSAGLQNRQALAAPGLEGSIPSPLRSRDPLVQWVPACARARGRAGRSRPGPHQLRPEGFIPPTSARGLTRELPCRAQPPTRAQDALQREQRLVATRAPITSRRRGALSLSPAEASIFRASDDTLGPRPMRVPGVGQRSRLLWRGLR